jgi:hypothetical protein
MSDPDEFVGYRVSVDKYVGRVAIEIGRSGDAFTLRRFDQSGVPFGLPVDALPTGDRLVALDLGHDEVGAVTLTLAAGGATLLLWLSDSDRAIRFVRAHTP